MHRWSGLLVSLVLAWSGTALAQDDDEFLDDDEEMVEDDGDGSMEDGSMDDESMDDESMDDGGDPAADEGEQDDASSGDRIAPDGWAFGPYLRFVFVPSFMLELFTEEAPTVGNVAFGAAGTYRPPGGGMAFEVGIGYTSYAFEDAFRATGDPIEDTEWLESDLGMVHLTGSLLWEAELVPQMLSLEYGIGLDFGVVVGTLVRSEAALDPNDGWRKCLGPGNPGFFSTNGEPYCESNNGFAVSAAYDEMGAHYNVEEERVPPVAITPMLPRVGLAYSPIPEVIGKVDLAYGIFQFWFGLSVAYSPEF